MKLSGMLADRTKARSTPGKVLPLIKEGMLKDFAAGSDRRWDIIHPSELSHQKTFCARSVYLRITEGPLPPENFDWGLQNIFDEGHSIHAKWQTRLRRNTNLWGNWKCLICGKAARNILEPFGYDHIGPRVDFDCDFSPSDGSPAGSYHMWEYAEIGLDATDEAMMYGHADGGFDNTLVELKSVGTGTVRIEEPEMFKEADGDLQQLWRGITRPFKTHLNQGDIYLWICNQRGLPFDEISFVYESKWNQQIKEFVVPYNEARSMVLIDQAMELKYCVEHREEPDCRWGDTCKECKPYDARRNDEPKRIVRDKNASSGHPAG